MKALTYVFGASVAGVAFCLVMTIVTGVKEHREQSQPAPITIPTPAMAR